MFLTVMCLLITAPVLIVKRSIYSSWCTAPIIKKPTVMLESSLFSCHSQTTVQMTILLSPVFKAWHYTVG